MKPDPSNNSSTSFSLTSFSSMTFSSMKIDFSGLKILVVGDVILDKYYYGKVSRISPEAPVPVVKVFNEKHLPGGSGNVVNNIRGLGAGAYHICITGKDEDSKILRGLLSWPNIENRFIENNDKTVTKIRVIGEHQQVVRLDFEEIEDMSASTREKIITSINSAINNVKAVIISDYGKGVCTPEICRHLIHQSNNRDIPVIVDPKGYDWEKYREAALITPNVKELGEVAGREIPNSDNEIEKYAYEIMNRFSIKNMLITRSDKGMSLVTGDTAFHIPTEALEVYDVSGAGDTVVAALSAGIAAGLSLTESARLANRAAGIAVSKFGTAPVELDELIHSFHSGAGSKILSMNILTGVIDRLNRKEKTIVYTSGNFDHIDIETIKMLKKAAKQGDILIVGIENNTKNNQQETGEIIASLEAVDYVILLNSDNLPETIKNKLSIIIPGGTNTD